MDERLLAIEFHDSLLIEMRVDSSFAVHFAFADLVCYYASKSMAEADVWTCAAIMTIANAKEMTIQMPFASYAKLVADFDFQSESAQLDVSNLWLLNGERFKSARLTLENDAVVLAANGVAKLSIGLRSRLLEKVQWPMV